MERVVTIADTQVHVEVASTEAARERGLSGHAPLGEGEGMLFIFDKDAEWGIWMKDMTFSLDIVWADSSGTVIHTVENVEPESYPAVFKPDSPAHYVVELPAGYVKAHGVKVGDKIGV